MDRPIQIEILDARLEIASVINNCISKYKIPACIMTGIIAQEMSRIQSLELLETTQIRNAYEVSKDGNVEQSI